MKDVIITSDAFERWSQKLKIRFIKDFRDAYNDEKKTDYQITSVSLQDAADYDFTLTSRTGDLLKIQHTFAAADPESEYIGPKLQAALVAKLNNDLKNLKNVHISIDFKEIKNKKEAAILTEEIEKIVNNVVSSANQQPGTELKSLFHYRWTDATKSPISKTIETYLSELRIYSSPYDQITFGYGGQSSSVLADDARADQAIRQKEKHYSDPSDIVLIVHYNFPLFRDFFEPIIKEKHAKSPFMGVWLFDAWKDHFIFIK